MLNGQRTDYYRGAGGHLALMHQFKGGTQGQMYWYHYNNKGDVAGLTKHNGNSHHNYRYDPYGAVLPENGNFTDPHNHYTLTGKEFDENTGLVWFGSRHYEPETGVWMGQDVYRGGLNSPMSLHRYGYVVNNPLTYYDYYGYYWGESVVNGVVDGTKSVAGAVGSGIASGYNSTKKGVIATAKAVDKYVVDPTADFIGNYVIEPTVEYLDRATSEENLVEMPGVQQGVATLFYVNALYSNVKETPTDLIFDANDNMSVNIESSSQYKKMIAAEVSIAEQKGKKCIDKTYYEEESINLRGANFLNQYAIGGTNRTTIKGEKMDSGEWSIETTIIDKYDFQKKSREKEGLAKTFINNFFGYYPQEFGILETYTNEFNIKSTVSAEN